MPDAFARLRATGVVYADHAATTQLPDSLARLVAECALAPRANAWRGLSSWAEHETEILEQSRARIGVAAGCVGYDVRFHRGVTQALNALARSAQDLFGDHFVVAVSDLEHQANVLPWKEVSSEVRSFSTLGPFDFSGVQVVAVTAASNVTGEAPDVAVIVQAAHAAGALVVVDAAQYSAHASFPRDGWGADVLVTSGHKMYGPVAVGAWFFAPECPLRPSVHGGGMVEQAGWEAGTWSAADTHVLAAAWDFCVENRDDAAWQAVRRVEEVLGDRVVRSRGTRVAPMVSFMPQEHPHDFAARLGASGVAVRAGLLCAPVAMATYGVAATGVVRFSFGAMTTREDIERLIPLL